MARDAAVWFVMIDGEQRGPMSRVELGLEYASGAIDGETHVWKDGMGEWLPAAELPDLAALFSPQPPKPPVSRPPPPPAAAVQKSKAATAARPAAKGKPAPRAAPEPKPEKHGGGMQELDTGHFRLAELAVKDLGADGGHKGMNEFNTGHFKVQEVSGKSIADALQKVSEFDTSHFRLADLKSPALKADDGPLSLDLEGHEHKPGVVGYPNAKNQVVAAAGASAPARPAATPSKAAVARPLRAAAAAKAAPAAAKPAPAKPLSRFAVKPQPFDPNRTSIEKIPLGEQVHQEKLAGELFDDGADEPPDDAPPAPLPPAPLAEPRAAVKLAPARQGLVARVPVAQAPVEPKRRSGVPVVVLGGIAFAALLLLWLIFR